MQVKIFPSVISGILNAPPSKSSMQRACAAALLHNGITEIRNAGTSNDDTAALRIITQLGANISQEGDILSVSSSGFPAKLKQENKIINCGESGLAVRMFTPVAALSAAEIILTGEGSLVKRPMDFFDKVFPQLKIKIVSHNGFLPLQITGPLTPADIVIDGSLSSQFLTGLLYAYGASVKEQKCIHVTDLKSTPYIDLTLDVMRRFGYDITHENYERFTINKKADNSDALIDYTVEGDWSSASFLLVAGAISGGVKLSGLDIRSSQADKEILNVLRSSGAEIKITANNVEVNKKELAAFTFDATHCPDLFPPLVALAAYCKGSSVIKGIHRLATKESNRCETLQKVFSAMGVDISIRNDDMVITGGGVLRSAVVSSHHDHRIAMAAAVAGLGATGTTSILHAEAINKSYPDFFKDIKKSGAVLEISES